MGVWGRGEGFEQKGVTTMTRGESVSCVATGWQSIVRRCIVCRGKWVEDRLVVGAKARGLGGVEGKRAEPFGA